MPDWSFVTNHGLILAAIVKCPCSTARQIGDTVGITERAAHRIISDLEAAGYVIKTRAGRRNEYAVDLDMPAKIKASDATIGEFLMTLGWKPEEKRQRKHQSKKLRNQKTSQPG